MSVNNVGSPTNHPGPRVTEGSSAEQRAESSQRTQPVTSSSGVDTVSITSAGARLQQVAEAAANAPDVDVKRVQAVKQAIDSGTFEINANNIAEKMIAFDSAVAKSTRE